jgi:subtilisin family serine protease
MFSFRRTISTGVSVSVALFALTVIASAPAASGGAAQERLFLTGTARAPLVRTIERAPALPMRHLRGVAKLDGRLAGLAHKNRRAMTMRLDAGDRAMRAGIVRVVVETEHPASVRTIVTALGGRVERVSGMLVQASMPQTAVTALSRRPAVDFVRAPYTRVEHAVDGEEIAASLASQWHGKGFTGKGVKIAVIDGGFQGLAERQAAGDLPSAVVTGDYCGGRFASATEHGTAVAEIVHEMAPEAELYLLCIDTELDLAAAVGFAKARGVKIVNHSMGWFGPARGDGSGYIGSIVADAKASGILWVNSAGNEAETHWAGTFDPRGDPVHDWSPNGDEGNSFVWPDGSVICGLLRWDEWPAGVSDFDLALALSGTNELVGLSEGYQTGSQPPIEGMCMEQTTGVDLVVYWAILGYEVRSSPRFDLFSFSPPLQYQTAAGSVVDPATSSAAFAVGALCWQTRQLEPYSSQGPTIDGRTKPDIAGHDSVSSATYGPSGPCPSGFAGTSASSPEVAGAAALVKQAYPAYGPVELQQLLMRSAVDISVPGPDNATGMGELKLAKPPDVVVPTATALATSGRMGRLVRLVSKIADDSGEVRLTDKVKRNGRVIATLQKGFVSARGRKTVSLVWKAPANGRGSYQHCVRATDRAGNDSAISCARVVLE